MSEKFTHRSPESSHAHGGETEHRTRHEAEIPQHAHEHGNEEQLEAQRLVVEQHAKSAHEHAHSKQENTPHHPVLINKQLKETAFSRSMIRTRKKLSAPSRALSKVIHTPVIEQTSETLSKTVARPSSMLGGAFFALLGTSILLWVTRRYGYEYNYLAVILLFGGGLVIGLSIEGLWRLLSKNRTRQ
jgi:hypothetical protein